MNDASEMPVVRVMIVDDHSGFRAALRSILKNRDWLELTRDATSGEDALKLLEGERPDVVLMDISLPGMNGLDATREVVRASSARVIGLSMHERSAYAARMREAGAEELLAKSGPIDVLLKTIESVAAGESVWGRDLDEDAAPSRA